MKLILCGGGSAEQNLIANQKIAELIDTTKPILYVPLAKENENISYFECYKWLENELKDIDIPYIDMVKSFDELERKKLNNYSAIYIGGGNTYKLLKGLKETKTFENIKEYLSNDGMVIGSSAGSIIFGYDIDVIFPMDNNNVKLKDTKGFNYLNGISIFPHYKNKKNTNINREKKYTEWMTKFSYKSTVIAIPEEDAIYFDGENIEVIGSFPYHIFKNGEVMKCDIQSDKYLVR